MHATNRTNLQAIDLLAAVLAAAVIATATPGAAGEVNAARVPTATSTQESISGVATGETVKGVPVYRLPPITVTASRRVELAKIAREETIARAKRHHANVAATMPATRPARVTLAPHSIQN